MRYVPALKAREAEIKALLKAPLSLDVTPIFELQEASAAQKDPATGLPKRSKSSVTDASYFVDDVARLWPGPMYVDISRLTTGSSRVGWWRLLSALNAMASPALPMIPVFIPGESAASLDAAKPLVSASGRAALRVNMQDARRGASAIVSAIPRIVADAGAARSSLDVILDWEDTLESVPLDVLESDTAAVIAAVGAPVGDFVSLGTPNSAAFTQTGDWAVDRREWWLWLRLSASGYRVAYGDYALYPPASPAPAPPKYGHLRYSSGDRLYVHRRSIPGSSQTRL